MIGGPSSISTTGARLTADDVTAAARPELLDVGRLAELAGHLFSPDHRRLQALVDRLCLHMCLQVIHAHGLFTPGRPAETRQGLRRVVSGPRSAYLLDTVVAILIEEGYVVAAGGLIVRLRDLPEPDLSGLHAVAAAHWPREPFFDLLDRCGRNLLNVLAGRHRGWDAIFRRGDLSLWDRLHNDNAIKTPPARLAAAAAASLVGPHATIREFGAGTGAGTAWRLRELADVPVRRYRSTAISPVFLRVGSRRFGQHPFLEFGEHDLNGPVELAVPPRSVDLVFDVNALHIARSLPSAVDRLRAALRPGGWIVLGEGSPPGPGRTWRPDPAFGFLDGWWAVQLDAPFRPRPGFLRPAQWLDLLHSRGFSSVAAIPGVGGEVVGAASDRET